MNITVGVGTVALLLAIIFTALFWALPAHRSILTFAAAVLTAAATITSAFYIGQSLRQSVESEKMTRTIAYGARWNDPQFFHAKKAAYTVSEILRQKRGKKGAHD